MRHIYWTGYKTIVRKEVTRILRIWGQTIVPPAITMTLYFIIFGELIGRRIGDMAGFSYMQYIVPGLVIMSVITNSYGNMVSSFFGAKFGKHIEELLISPLPNWVILAGYVTGALTRGLMVGVVVMAGLLAWEQVIVRGGDLRRIDKAFFTINSWVGMILLAVDAWGNRLMVIDTGGPASLAMAQQVGQAHQHQSQRQP